MAVFLSAGHNSKGNKDSGAVSKYGEEANFTVEIRDLVIAEAKKLGLKPISDRDDERLAQYLQRIQTGSGSVVLEFHFDSADSESATGCTMIVGADADRYDKAFAKEIVDATSRILGIRNRGVISESDSHRGRLGLMREQGTVGLLEVGFISNGNDMKAYNLHKNELAVEIARIVKKYEDLIQ